MKRVGILLGVLVLLFALASCAEAGGPMTAKMLEGTWKFDGGWEISFMDECEGIIDADVDHYVPDDDADPRVAFLHVQLKKNKLVGDYDSAEGNQNISITMTYKNETLSLKFSGEGFLNGLSLTGGKKDNE